MLEIEHISLISDEMRAVVEEDGQSWRTSCRRRRSVKDDGETVFRHACKIGLEDIMSKRKDSAYRSGRSPDTSALLRSRRQRPRRCRAADERDELAAARPRV